MSILSTIWCPLSLPLIVAKDSRNLLFFILLSLLWSLPLSLYKSCAFWLTMKLTKADFKSIYEKENHFQLQTNFLPRKGKVNKKLHFRDIFFVQFFVFHYCATFNDHDFFYNFIFLRELTRDSTQTWKLISFSWYQ